MDVTVSMWQALAIAVWVAMVMSRSILGGATLTLRFSPLMTGFVGGLVFGNVADAMVITAAIQLIYMGVFSPGGQMPSEPCIAAAIAVPVALLSGMGPEAAVGIAVPVGLLGSYLYQFRFFVNTFIARSFMDNAAKEADSRKLTISIIWLPTLVSFLIFVPFMFIALYLGTPLIASFVESASGTIIFHILEVIGGGLAAIGIAVTVYVIGKKNYIPFFLLAYFMAVMFSSLEITMVTYAILGALIAYIFVMAQGSSTAGMVSGSSADEDDDDY
ncbi:PTS mannose/fructose/sorbose/N-acetylgalactosamine transporter subunit IIC [Aerococcus mictus]|uniref:PTS mannose/fructose/sorbose/N-acetylgalactosamine transporter subunit IIC n=1 Tax=Aerococcus mictus TaxID=2976810 RepID=UPI000DCB6F0B|nr:PTS sugar transporter subunit IIC [Aerococcus mictus]WMF96100.1 PTS sugar transporter subunit IIC [Aerococcus mictus]